MVPERYWHYCRYNARVIIIYWLDCGAGWRTYITYTQCAFVLNNNAGISGGDVSARRWKLIVNSRLRVAKFRRRTCRMLFQLPPPTYPSCYQINANDLGVNDNLYSVIDVYIDGAILHLSFLHATHYSREHFTCHLLLILLKFDL